ncbi:hypothetical protein [Nitrosomonas supralitoralis]|uniref:Uncharacterized protein n=1 Tax=Nitrosomonas supralitoralis TaxID=2116706 RepID=A0A2P7NW55_9PROT|nr:hypothetical protein [Nitrosomonas supralitoralis]PSJ17707.1 hypothetical protein C7H79_06785 [Nitrosomonas supralitoralis]
MKKNIAWKICAAFLFMAGVHSALAESVAVQSNTIFVLDNSVAGSQIVVKNLPDGAANSCLIDAESNLLGLSTDTIATDIIVKNSTAVITTYNNVSLMTDVKLVDVSSCPLTDIVDLSECYASFQDGQLTIPCLKHKNDIISVILGQRGNSMNFEFESYKPGKRHDHGNDD